MAARPLRAPACDDVLAPGDANLRGLHATHLQNGDLARIQRDNGGWVGFWLGWIPFAVELAPEVLSLELSQSLGDAISRLSIKAMAILQYFNVASTRWATR